MRRSAMIAVVAGGLTVLLTYGLVSSPSHLAWRFAPEPMIRDYVIALLACKEDMHRGATALARLQDTYGIWREELLPHGIYYWVVQCQEMGPLPEFSLNLDRWLQ